MKTVGFYRKNAINLEEHIYSKHIDKFDLKKCVGLISHIDIFIILRGICLYVGDRNVPCACREPGTNSGNTADGVKSIVLLYATWYRTPQQT